MIGGDAGAETTLDPVTLEVIRNALPAIADEMSVDLQRTSYNMMIYEVRDYCCALLDADGPADLAEHRRRVALRRRPRRRDQGRVERYGVDGFQPGDVIITNHQRVAGQHLNNVVHLHAVLRRRRAGGVRDRARALGRRRRHQHRVRRGDAVTDPWMEGLQFDQIKIYEAGEPDEKMLRHDLRQHPLPGVVDGRHALADRRLHAGRAAARASSTTATARETIAHAIERIFDETEERCRLVVERIPDGDYDAES